MRQEKIILFDVDLLTFKNEKTGEVEELTRLSYLREKADHSGYRVLKSYAKGNLIDKFSKFICKANLNVFLEEKDTPDGIKFKISKIENEKI